MWHKSSSSSRGYGSAWRKIRAYILDVEPLCRMCTAAGRVTPATQLDHIVPKAKGGTDSVDNLQPLCKPCHDNKTIQDSGGKIRPKIGLDGWPE